MFPNFAASSDRRPLMVSVLISTVPTDYSVGPFDAVDHGSVVAFPTASSMDSHCPFSTAQLSASSFDAVLFSCL